MECKRYNFTAQNVSKCLFFTFNLETNSSVMDEKGTKEIPFKFDKLMKNNALPAQSPPWLPYRPTPKI